LKLTPRFALAFIAYAALLLASVAILAFKSGQESLRQSTVAELEATATRKESNLDRWIQGRQAAIIALAADPAVISEVGRLREAAPNSPEFQNAYELFLGTIRTRMDVSEFLEVHLLHPESGEVIVSTTPEEEGTSRANEAYFLGGQSDPFVENPSYSPDLRRSMMAASAPLVGPDGVLLGVLAADLDLEALNDVIGRPTNLHQTDDAYLVSSTSFLITRPRFPGDVEAYQNGVVSEPITRCLRQESGVLEAPDFRNIDAFVVYRWLPERQACLVVKIDQAEAYAPIRSFGGTIAAIGVVGLMIAAALAIVLARSMTRPILALQEGVARFRRGELDSRLDKSAPDELGELAGEFNKMADALVEQQTHLRRQAEQFFNLSPDLLCTLDIDYHLLELNPAWEQVLGYRRAELKRKTLTDVVHPDDVVMTRAALRRIVNEGSGRFEHRCLHRDGQYRWLAWVVAASSQEQLLYGAARDITERRQAEEKLRQQTEELERTNRELEEIAYVASHDLQEPLRLVSNHVQFLARRYQGRLDEDADEFIGVAVEGTNRMKSLLADLLAYTGISTGPMDYGSVEMEEVFAQVFENMQAEIESSRAIITHDTLPTVLGNTAQLMLLLQNLLDNAIKFCSKDPPRVHVGVSQVTERWLFFVRDNGIGIDPRYTERVFAIFQRLHSRDDYPGTGTGLAISRKIVERHGGRIWVDSEPGKGATFYFTLQPVEGMPEMSLPEPAATRSRRTVVDRATDLI
jgi:PAS domain S-box-containing protein